MGQIHQAYLNTYLNLSVLRSININSASSLHNKCTCVQVRAAYTAYLIHLAGCVCQRACPFTGQLGTYTPPTVREHTTFIALGQGPTKVTWAICGARLELEPASPRSRSSMAIHNRRNLRSTTPQINHRPLQTAQNLCCVNSNPNKLHATSDSQCRRWSNFGTAGAVDITVTIISYHSLLAT